MQRILITGATGLVGQEIVKQCHAQDIAVNYLSTSTAKLESNTNYRGFYYNPKKGEIDVNCFNYVDTIINLAGAPISKRWTTSYKAEILKSRVEVLALLYETIRKNNISIKQLVSASAIGIYPHSQTHYYDESFKDFEDSFLGEVAREWEEQANKFHELEIKVAIVRIGIVLAKHGGALSHLAKPIKAYVGSPLGTGKQWQSWIHIHDLSAMFLHVAENSLKGVFNGVAPNPTTQKQLIKALAKVLNKPIWFPKVSSGILKLILGEMSALVLESQRVSSRKIENHGFIFKYHHLQPALFSLV